MNPNSTLTRAVIAAAAVAALLTLYVLSGSQSSTEMSESVASVENVQPANVPLSAPPDPPLVADPQGSVAKSPSQPAQAESVGGARTRVMYEDATPAAGLLVYAAPFVNESVCRRVDEGVSTLVGVLDEHGALPPDREEQVPDGAVAIAYDSSCAALVPSAQWRERRTISIARATPRELVLEASMAFREDPGSSFELLLRSGAANFYANPWDGGQLAPERFFEECSLRVCRDTSAERYAARRLRFDDATTRIEMALPAGVYHLTVQRAPFGWWVDDQELAVEPNARTLALRPYRVPVHDVALLDESGAPLPPPHEMRLAAKRVEGDWFTPMYEARIPHRAVDGGALLQIALHERWLRNPIAIVAYWELELSLEGNVYIEVVPAHFEIRGTPTAKRGHRRPR